MLKKFKKDDILTNSVRTYPKTTFDIWNTKVFLNKKSQYSGSFDGNLMHVSQGFLSLLELNVDRDFAAHTYDPDLNSGVKSKIFPYVYKDSSLFSTVGMEEATFNADYLYGDIITASYDVSASMTRTYFSASATRSQVAALRNSFDYYKRISPHLAYSSSYGDKSTQAINLLNIPKIFYGETIQKGSVSLSFFISGSLIGQAVDIYKNGLLYQVSGSGSGSVAGHVLYNEGIISLTGSWNLSATTYKFDTGAAHTPKWLDFAAGCNDGTPSSDITPSASFSVEFCGNNPVQTTLMFCTADKGYFNFSNNPTFYNRQSSSFTIVSGSSGFQEEDRYIQNVVTSSFHDFSESFQRITYITDIYIHDDFGNILGIAKLARPHRKLENVDYTFKIKYDS
jgi:hypothetical protein